MSRLFIAAKAPRPGFVKTRLARHIGERAATALYLAFLTDLAARFSLAPFATGWFITPDDAGSEVIGRLALHPLIELVGQGEGTWGERQDRLFATLLAADGAEPVVLIGSDSPHLTVEYVEQALALLETHDVVFGPALDGGYALVAMSRYHSLLAEGSMSVAGVLDNLLDLAARRGLIVGLLEPTFDIDEVTDLPPLAALCEQRHDLPATRRALSDLSASGLPGVERETA